MTAIWALALHTATTETHAVGDHTSRGRGWRGTPFSETSENGISILSGFCATNVRYVLHMREVRKEIELSIHPDESGESKWWDRRYQVNEMAHAKSQELYDPIWNVNRHDRVVFRPWVWKKLKITIDLLAVKQDERSIFWSKSYGQWQFFATSYEGLMAFWPGIAHQPDRLWTRFLGITLFQDLDRDQYISDWDWSGLLAFRLLPTLNTILLNIANCLRYIFVTVLLVFLEGSPYIYPGHSLSSPSDRPLICASFLSSPNVVMHVMGLWRKSLSGYQLQLQFQRTLGLSEGWGKKQRIRYSW